MKKLLNLIKKKYILSGFLYQLGVSLILVINFTKIKENTFLVFYIGLSIIPILLILATKVLRK